MGDIGHKCLRHLLKLEFDLEMKSDKGNSLLHWRLQDKGYCLHTHPGAWEVLARSTVFSVKQSFCVKMLVTVPTLCI